MSVGRPEIEEALESPEKWKNFRARLSGSLSDIHFSGENLEGYDFSDLDLERCSFDQSNLDGCDFSRSNLYETSWRNAHLDRCKFLGALLTSSDFGEAEFLNCDFSGAELSRCSSQDVSFDNCDLSRSRGISQHFLDQAVGDTQTQIPQFLDYPEHWLLSEDEKQEKIWIKRLTALRGDDIILCTFDSEGLHLEDFAPNGRDDLREALDHLQKKVSQAIEQNIFHNESPAVWRAICDYHYVLTSSAGEGRQRWKRKIYEIEEVKVGLEGSSLISQVQACRRDLEDAFPEKLAKIDHIIQAHLLFASGLTRWKTFLQSAGEANLKADDVAEISDLAEAVCEVLESDSEMVDSEIPSVIRSIQKIAKQSSDVAKIAGFGIVRCVESIFNAVFSFSKEFVGKAREELLEYAPRVSVRLLVNGLLAAGVLSMFSKLPYLKTWVDGGLSVLRALGVL